jgi:hypothetical protein
MQNPKIAPSAMMPNSLSYLIAFKSISTPIVSAKAFIFCGSLSNV